MDTDGGTTPAARSGTTRPAPDPLQMSAAEKCMAEWEARHDVSARGHRASPEAVQHYIARSRLGPPARPHPPAAAAAPAQRPEPREPVPPPQAVPDQPKPRSGSLLDRLMRPVR